MAKGDSPKNNDTANSMAPFLPITCAKRPYSGVIAARPSRYAVPSHEAYSISSVLLPG